MWASKVLCRGRYVVAHAGERPYGLLTGRVGLYVFLPCMCGMFSERFPSHVEQ